MAERETSKTVGRREMGLTKSGDGDDVISLEDSG